MNPAEEMIRVIEQAAFRLGRDVETYGSELKDYAATRMEFLSTILDEPGFDEALEAERDNVVLKMALGIVDGADAADAELLGVVAGTLSMGARLLAGGAA